MAYSLRRLLRAPNCDLGESENVYFEHFDLDGFDAVGIRLNDYPDRPITRENVAPEDRRGIAEIRSLLVSFDDDGNLGWRDCDPSRFPVETPSPAGETYGRAALHEVLWISLSGGAFPWTSSEPKKYKTEEDLSPSLAPDPKGSIEALDDDIDALDWISSGDRSYFSVDQEGASTGYVEGVGEVLEPDVIYLSATDPAPVGVQLLPLVTQWDLSIPLETDVDAFEFVWLPEDPTSDGSPRALALAFSVDEDDEYTTAQDESGGMDPNAVYASWMDGEHFELVSDLGDDVDALTVLPRKGPLVKRGKQQ